MLPKITELEFDTDVLEPAQRGKVFLFDYEQGDFVYRNGAPVELEGIEAIKAIINKLILTERFKFNIYQDVEYGISLEDLLGSKLPQDFIQSEIERELTESILKLDEVMNISKFTFLKDGAKWTINFTVQSIYDEFEMEVA